MNSMINPNLSQATVTKAKATALKYQRFCRKKDADNSKTHKTRPQKCIKHVHNTLNWVWNSVMPKWLRGPSTPYEQLMTSISRITVKIQIDHLPFSQLTINQAIVRSRVKLIITYTENLLSGTLEKVTQSQQINALINKKAQILPIKIKDNPIGEVCLTLKQLMDSLSTNMPYHEQVFVVWKGLFQEILVIAHFQLSDPNLYSNVMTAIQERQDYQQYVRKLARGTESPFYDQSSLNKFDEQSTGIQKDAQD